MISHHDLNADVWTVDWGMIDGDGSPARLLRVSTKDGTSVRLRDIDLTVQPGQVVAVVGPNRAGKTAVLELLAGLRAPSSGEVRVFGRDPREPAVRAKLGMSPFESMTTNDATVEAALRTTLRWCGGDVDATLRQVRMGALDQARFGLLPPLIRTRLMIDVAFAGNPRLVLLDEPFADLSPEDHREALASFRHHRSADRAMVFTTRNLNEATELADVMVVLEGGNVIATGHPATLRQAPLARLIRFRSERVDLPTLARLDGVVGVHEDYPIVEVHSLRPTETLRDLVGLGQTLMDIEIGQEPLGDAFPVAHD